MPLLPRSAALPARPTRWLVLLLIALAPAWAGQDLLWFAAERPTAQALEAIAVLRSADTQGLDPDDYDAQRLGLAVHRALQGPARSTEARARLDAALTAALLRYLSDLQRGRIDPRQVHARFDAPQPAVSDSAAYLRAAVDGNRLRDAVQDLASRQPMAQRLRQALAQYRALGPDAAWSRPLAVPAGGKLVAGQPYADLHELARRLRALGDLPAASPLAGTFDAPLVAALEQFQQRHGLLRDGVLGRDTLAQLAVTPAQRARQIELALERMRWTPYLQAPRMIVVNVPEFTLRAYEVHGERIDVRLTMRIIVGKALDTRTPLFDGDMRFIEFSPYWNVPYSIARNETVPRLRADPAYFAQQGLEFVTDRGEVVATLSGAHLDAVLAGRWRIRQRPGPGNALGSIKFVFPNNANIYLHDTPAPLLFARGRRDLSHGCIRVEAPLALAQFVLQDDPAWTEERIRAAMAQGQSRTIRLRQPLPVLIAYSTVVVKGGLVHFYPDLYHHDAALDRALRARSAALLRERPAF